MNEVSIIRKGSYKSYLANGASGGLILGILFFLLYLTQKSFLTSIIIGFVFWIGMIIVFGMGFIGEEYFNRKKKIKKLLSEKYSFLLLNGFAIHENLFFEGLFRNYFIRILPMTNRQQKKEDIEYDIIEAIYSFDIDEDNNDLEQRLSGNYDFGKLNFAHNCVEFLPEDWEAPDFKENLDNLICLFEKEGLKPITRKDWDELYGNKLKAEQELKEKAKTKQILKIGKLDIKYVKPDKER
jgi:hypothetical protein